MTPPKPSHAAGETTTPLLEETIGANLERTVGYWPDREALVEVATGRGGSGANSTMPPTRSAGA